MNKLKADNTARHAQRAAQRQTTKMNERESQRKRQKVQSRENVLMAASMEAERALGLGEISTSREYELWDHARATVESEDIRQRGRVRRQRTQFVPMSMYF